MHVGYEGNVRGFVCGGRGGGEKGLGTVDLSNYNIVGLQCHQRFFSLSSTAQHAGGI